MGSPTVEQINAARSGFDLLYGVEFLEISETLVRAQLPLRAEICQPYGLIHGGVYASLAESMSSIATALAVIGDGQIAMGQANDTSFLRPISEGTVHAAGNLLHRGRTTWVWDISFSDDAGRTCAVTRMTIAVRPRPS